jgi:hypothetical protein
MTKEINLALDQFGEAALRGKFDAALKNEEKDNRIIYLKLFFEQLDSDIALAGRFSYSETVKANGTVNLILNMDKKRFGDIEFYRGGDSFTYATDAEGFFRHWLRDDNKEAFLAKAIQDISEEAHNLARLPMPQPKRRLLGLLPPKK